MSAVVKANPQLPAAISKLLAVGGEEIFQEVTGGVTSGFPVISYRGKVWRIRKGGSEDNVVDDQGDPVPNIEVVLIKSNPQPSKIFYGTAYEEGGSEAPSCWSADGIKPDSGVQQPVAKSCAACPNNVWGSKITPQGNKTKLCADARRMAVVSRHELETKGADALLCLLRVPPASLNPLKDYAEKVLKPKGIPYFAVVTKIGFDPNSSYPKLTFKAVRFLSEEEAEIILKLRNSEDARRILAESTEFDAAGNTGGSEAAEVTDSAEATPAPAASAKKKAAKPRPAEEEDVGLDEEEIAAPAPAPAAKKRAAAPPPPPVEEEEAEEDIPAPPPAPAKRRAAAPPPPPVEEEAEEEIAAPAPAPAAKKKAATAAAKKPAAAKPAAGEDFDSMLDSILNG